MAKIVGYGQTDFVSRMQKTSLFGYERQGVIEREYSPYSSMSGFSIRDQPPPKGMICPDGSTYMQAKIDTGQTDWLGNPVYDYKYKCCFTDASGGCAMMSDPYPEPVPPVIPAAPACQFGPAIANPNPAAPNPWICPPDPNLCQTGPWSYDAASGAWVCTGQAPAMPTCASTHYASFINGKWVCVPRSTPTPPPAKQQCPAGQHGTYPDCIDDACPKGYTGTPPNCKKKPDLALIVGVGLTAVAGLLLLAARGRDDEG